MDKELDLLLNLLDNPDLSVLEERIVEGKMGKHHVVIAKCGIGKVNAALNAYKLIERFHPDIILNSGVAGGAGIPIGSLLVADKVAYHDVWCGPGTIYGQADGMPEFLIPDKKVLSILSNHASHDSIVTGLICSGDKFISNADEIAFIKSKFPDVKAVDMESATIAQVAMSEEIPFAIVRVVSDTPGEGENISQYKDFWTNAPVKTFNLIKDLLTNLE